MTALTLAWTSDIHLDTVRRRNNGAYERFVEELNVIRPSYLLITGDISTNNDFVRDISTLHRDVRTSRIFYVLGNHDHWFGSVNFAQEKAREASTYDQVYLPDEGPVRIAPDVILVGTDGWYDARRGKINGRLVMHDWENIIEFSDRGSIDRIVDLARHLAKEQNTLMAGHLKVALGMNSKNIIVATHVPPFIEAVQAKANAQNRIVEDILPWYMNFELGQMLEATALANPGVSFTVLSGHTHVGVTVQRAHNLVFKAAAAAYGSPCIAEIIQLGDSGSDDDGRTAARDD